MAAALGSSGAFDLAKAFGVPLVLAVFEWKVRRRGLAGRLAIRGDVVHHGDFAALPMDRIRRIDVVPEGDGHAVRLGTSDGDLIVARPPPAPGQTNARKAWEHTNKPTTRMAKEHIVELRTRTRVRTLNERYELKRVIGEGGMAEVYLATDLVLERDVAVKVLRRNLALDEAHRERFRREALALASVDSPFVVPALDVGVDGEDHYFVMRYVHGKTLGQLITKHGTLPLERTLRIIGDVLDGVQALHDKNLIHRDLKADIVLVDWDDRAAIADLGVAADRGRPTLTAPNTTLGTVSMMPPEQRTSGHVDRRTDTYHVGLLLLHMLTGIVPDTGDPQSLLEQIELVQPSLRAIVRQAVDADIERRWWSARELKQALRAATTPAPAPSSVPVVELRAITTSPKLPTRAAPTSDVLPPLALPIATLAAFFAILAAFLSG
ncbi:MAG TPA: serine/threonine-protein kinase [Kofleriaceae bacterium]|nr:serine/threonine-protein kinase [Kofleriaceae bacterium]